MASRGSYVSATAFHHRAADIDWYCEQRGVGSPVVLIPSGGWSLPVYREVIAADAAAVDF